MPVAEEPATELIPAEFAGSDVFELESSEQAEFKATLLIKTSNSGTVDRSSIGVHLGYSRNANARTAQGAARPSAVCIARASSAIWSMCFHFAAHTHAHRSGTNRPLVLTSLDVQSSDAIFATAFATFARG